MPTVIRPAAALAFFAGIVLAPPTVAADAQVPATVPGSSVGRVAGWRVSASRMTTLAGIVDRLDWDSQVRGPLLIVSPEETTFYGFRGEGPEVAPPNSDADGRYSVGVAAHYFDRRLVHLRTLTVLAPTTMSVLHYKDLPRPSADFGMTAGAKARVLESTLSTEQWRKFCSSPGIGIGDMTAVQRKLYLSMLPEPFTVRADTATGVPVSPVTLTPEQREGIRLQRHKALAWSYVIDNEFTHAADSPSYPRSGPALRLDRTLPATRSDTGMTAFGSVLRDSVANRAKASGLNYDDPRVAKVVTLGGDGSVGDLVHRIAQSVGMELYADPRYSDRKLSVQGTSASAGDLLRALALAITGTWRVVGPAYLLTDDLEGLGVRQGRIQDWVDRSVLLAENREAKAVLARTDDYFRFIDWREDDPLRPSDVLRQRIAAYNRNPVRDVDLPRPLRIPLADLPPLAQSTAPTDIAELRKYSGLVSLIGKTWFRKDVSIRTDVVDINIVDSTDYLIPGIGRVKATNIDGLAFATTKRLVRSRQVGGGGVVGAVTTPRVSEPVQFLPGTRVRAVLVGLPTKATVTALAAAARRSGFTQLWVRVPRGGDIELLTEIVRVGKTYGLDVQAVVCPLQAVPGDPTVLRDHNLLGETLTEYVRDRQTQAESVDFPVDVTPGFADGPNFRGAMLNRALSDGAPSLRRWRDADFDVLPNLHDCLRPEDDQVRRVVLHDLERTASVPGLAGLVLCDTGPLGYVRQSVPGSAPGPLSSSLLWEDPLAEMGNSEPMRLACLRKNGFDPIDLSLLPMNSELRIPWGLTDPGSSNGILLPFFGGFGPVLPPGRQISWRSPNGNGVRYQSLDVNDGRVKWEALRAQASADFTEATVDAIRAWSPGITLMTADGSLGQTYSFTGRGAANVALTNVLNPPPGDSKVPDLAGIIGLAPVTIGRRVLKRGSEWNTPAREREPAELPLRYLAFHCDADEIAGQMGGADARMIALQSALYTARGWDGVVIDLSDLSPARSRTILDGFAPAPESESAP